MTPRNISCARRTPWWKKLSLVQEQQIPADEYLRIGGDAENVSYSVGKIIAWRVHRREQADKEEQHRISQGIRRKKRQTNGRQVSPPQNGQKAIEKAASMFAMGIIDRNVVSARIRMRVRNQEMQDWESHHKLSSRWAAITQKRRGARVRALKCARDGLCKSEKEPVAGYHSFASLSSLLTLKWAHFSRKFECLYVLKKMTCELVEMGFNVREGGGSCDLVSEGRPVRSDSDDGRVRVVDSGTSGRDGNNLDGTRITVSAVNPRSESSDGGNARSIGSDPGQGTDIDDGGIEAADFEWSNDAQHAPLTALKHNLPIAALSWFATGLMSALSDTICTLTHTHSSTNDEADVGTLPNQTAVPEAADLHTVDASSINIGKNDNFFTSSLPTLWGRTGGSGRGGKQSMAARGRGTPQHRGNSPPTLQLQRAEEGDTLSVSASGSLAPSIRPQWEIDDRTIQATLASMKLGVAQPGDRYEEPLEDDGKSVTSYAESTKTAIGRESGPDAFRALVEDEVAINETLFNNIIPPLYQGQYRSTMQQCNSFGNLQLP
jgi:hypothetical protein